MTPQERMDAMIVAEVVSKRIPNGPTSGDFKRASLGQNEDLLEAIVQIVRTAVIVGSKKKDA